MIEEATGSNKYRTSQWNFAKNLDRNNPKIPGQIDDV
jgi:hypothetical protein